MHEHPALLKNLLALRYRLLWAQARSRSGKFALFLAFYLFAVFAAGLLMLGGVGAAVVAVRVGRAETVARVFLGGSFITAVLASVIVGIGVTPAFRDAALRRYPLSPGERFAARHLTAILEPLWLFALALDLGFIVGLAILGAGRVGVTIPAVVLLIASNYLVACVLVALVDRIQRTRLGRLVLLVGGLGLAVVGPLVPMHAVAPDGALLSGLGGVAVVLKAMPPFAAASAMVGAPPLASIGWLICLLAWCAGLGAAVIHLERRPYRPRIVAGGRAAWDDPYDRIAALFDTSMAPLVGKMLRYYLRSPQTRYNYPIALPSIALMISTMGRSKVAGVFSCALVGVGVMSGFCTGALSSNVFGFDGPGFRRYFLLPVPADRVLRAAAIVSLIPGATLIPAALLLWFLYAPIQTDARMAVMLLSSGIAGVLFFPAAGLWVSILSPSPIKFDAGWGSGNKLSFGANILMVAVIGVTCMGPFALHTLGEGTLIQRWWVMPMIAFAAAGFFVLTVRLGATVFVSRRERMLSRIDFQG
jgi:hypothetical protein